MAVSVCWGERKQRQSRQPRGGPCCLIHKMQKWKPMGAQDQLTQPGSNSTGLWVPVHPAFSLHHTGRLPTGPSSARLASNGSSLGNKHF